MQSEFKKMDNIASECIRFICPDNIPRDYFEAKGVSNLGEHFNYRLNSNDDWSRTGKVKMLQFKAFKF